MVMLKERGGAIKSAKPMFVNDDNPPCFAVVTPKPFTTFPQITDVRFFNRQTKEKKLI